MERVGKGFEGFLGAGRGTDAGGGGSETLSILAAPDDSPQLIQIKTDIEGYNSGRAAIFHDEAE